MRLRQRRHGRVLAHHKPLADYTFTDTLLAKAIRVLADAENATVPDETTSTQNDIAWTEQYLAGAKPARSGSRPSAMR